MLPFSGSFGIWLKTHLPDKFPELVTALLILLSPRGPAAAEREAGAGSPQGWALCGPHSCPRPLALPWAPEQGEQHDESQGTWDSRLCGGSSSVFCWDLPSPVFLGQIFVICRRYCLRRRLLCSLIINGLSFPAACVDDSAVVQILQ